MAPPPSSLIARLADICWPRLCAVPDCRRPVDRPRRHLCSACFERLPLCSGGGACEICGMTIPAKTANAFICEACTRRPPAFDRARSAARFAEPVSTLVKAFKYNQALWLQADLVDLLEGVVRAQLDPVAVDVVIPVPLYPRRLRARGYNQSALLARDLALRIGRRCDESSLARIRDTGHQARLHATARKQNLAGAFSALHPEFIRRRTVLLVDDVMTTGTTLEECSRILKKAGATRVWCATIARSEASR